MKRNDIVLTLGAALVAGTIGARASVRIPPLLPPHVAVMLRLPASAPGLLSVR